MFSSHPTWVRGLKLTAILLVVNSDKSHPTWVRGLKPRYYEYKLPQDIVAPYVGAWIETLYNISSDGSLMSHPTWVRGLKLKNLASQIIFMPSHPTWVRGLKLDVGQIVT